MYTQKSSLREMYFHILKVLTLFCTFIISLLIVTYSKKTILLKLRHPNTIWWIMWLLRVKYEALVRLHCAWMSMSIKPWQDLIIFFRIIRKISAYHSHHFLSVIRDCHQHIRSTSSVLLMTSDDDITNVWEGIDAFVSHD